MNTGLISSGLVSLSRDVVKAKPARKVVPYIKSPTPFLLPRPGVIAFSGGRTSGRMLWGILDAYDGKLPNDVLVCFCNTGKERTETLDFVNECSVRWGVHINWLEWRDGPGHVVVDYATADRVGDVFAAQMRTYVNRKDGTRGRKPLPNPVMRHCSSEMKVRTQRRFTDTVFGKAGIHKAIGFRADEAGRVLRAPTNAERREIIHAPLYDAGLVEEDVLNFWKKQPFDLQLKSYEGNCDLCFMKSRAKINKIMQERPDLVQWWVDRENECGASDRGGGAGGVFRKDRPNYATMLAEVQAGIAKDVGNHDDEMACSAAGCTD